MYARKTVKSDLQILPQQNSSNAVHHLLLPKCTNTFGGLRPHDHPHIRPPKSTMYAPGNFITRPLTRRLIRL